MKTVTTRTILTMDDMSVVCTRIQMKDDSNEGNHKIMLTGDFGHFISN